MRESSSAAVVDCGASKTVCGETWLNCHLDTLQETEKSAVKSDRSCSIFKFGDVVRGDKNVSIQTLIARSSFPTLPYKEQMLK